MNGVQGGMEAARAELKRVFGYDEFRSGQESAISSILAGRDILAILPTGGGKSICYQIPALLMGGVAIVISPLISLMKDQVDQLTQLGVEARALNSSVDPDEARCIMQDARMGRVKLLYIAPERLEFESCRAELWYLPISMVVIDEAHCVSQWGHDFRPSYLNIGEFIDGFAQRPIVAAFTATATENVSRDILSLLKLRAPELVKTGFDRPNLEFAIVRLKKNLRAGYIRRFMAEHHGESGIIYCSSRKDTETLAQELGALCYHAGMEDEARRRAQDAFINDENCVICATNAFGMGIDKPNVRYVLHYHMPSSVEAYWQEAGRAGRDGLAAECVLLSDSNDLNFWNQMINRDEAPDEEKAKRRARLRVMGQYVYTRKCLRQYLVGYFGEEIEDCGACSNCCGGADTATDTDITRQAQMILSAVKRSGEMFGAALIARILRGSRDKRIIELGLDRQSTYGLMSDTEQAVIKEYIEELVSQGLVDLSGGQYPILKLNELSAEVLRGQRRVMARIDGTAEEYAAEQGAGGDGKSARANRSRNERRGRDTDMRYYGTPLFERLKKLRKETAERKGVPAFVVFGDTSLIDMVKKQPRTPAQFLDINGVGEHKLKLYGAEFLREINAYLTEKADSAGNGEASSHAAGTNAFMNYLSGVADKASSGAGKGAGGAEFTAAGVNGAVAQQTRAATPNAIAVTPVSALSAEERRFKRMKSDLILFLRTHAEDFLEDFPDYSPDELNELVTRLRNGNE